MCQLSNRVLSVLILERLYNMQGSLLPGFRRVWTLPCWMCGLLVYFRIYMHFLLGWLFSEFAQLYRMLTSLCKLQFGSCLCYLPGFLLLDRDYLLSLPFDLCDLHCLYNMYHMRWWIFSWWHCLQRLYRQLQNLLRCNDMHNLHDWLHSYYRWVGLRSLQSPMCNLRPFRNVYRLLIRILLVEQYLLRLYKSM